MVNFKYKRILMYILGLIFISILIIAVAPFFIKPEAAQTMSQTIRSWWALSTVVQYLIYIGISFYLVPNMAKKKQQPLLLHQEELSEIHSETLFEGERIQLNKERNKIKEKLKKIELLGSIKTQAFIFGLLVVFDLVAGQLPFIMLKGG